jgi:organic radical activating enzyme
VFSSVQGEGPHVGLTTLFVRFAECDLRCRWCDSPNTWRPGPTCRLEVARGRGEFREVHNPLPIAAVVEAALALELASHRYVSLTGGEPLLQPRAAVELARALRAHGPRVLLETHGLATPALAEVVAEVDVVSMDWKLGSDVRRAGRPARGPEESFHALHETFLAVARRAPEVVVKVVVTPRSRDEELDAMALAVARTAPEAVVVVQPVTPFGPVKRAPDAARLLAITARLAQRLPDVRLIPQTHKLIGAL